MPEPPETLRTQTVFTGPKFAIVETCIRLATGTIHRHVTVRHPGAVVILPMLADGTLCVIKQYRYSVQDVLLEFPAGTREHGETPLQCAQRELAEEIGQAAARWQALGTLYPAPGFCDEMQYCFFATDLTPCTATRDEDEVIEVVPMQVAEVEEAIRTGRMMDGKSLAVYTRARLSGLL